jgi:hypothetical protein
MSLIALLFIAGLILKGILNLTELLIIWLDSKYEAKIAQFQLDWNQKKVTVGENSLMEANQNFPKPSGEHILIGTTNSLLDKRSA